MNKASIFVGAFGLLVVGALVFALTSNKAEAPNSSSSSQSSSINNSVKTDSQENSNTKNYIDYTDEVIAQTAGEKVLFFHAPWCAQCRSIEKGILSDGVPDGLTIVKVDYDSNQDLRQKYGITLQTTFVKIDDQGELKDKYVAYNEPTFDAVKRDFL